MQQRQIGQIIGADEATVYNWEKGYTVPALWFYPRIIEFLGYIPFEVKAKTLGEQLKNKRKQLGLSQRRLAKLLGVDFSTLGQWERGETQPLKRSIEVIVGFLKGVGI